MNRDFSFLKIAFTAPGQLTREEELELVKAYQAGDPKAFQKLRVSLRPLIEQVISTAIPKNNSVSASNLRMRADTVLPQILMNYDLNRGIRLNTYITSQLKGHMKNAVRETMIGPYVPRNQHDDLNRYNQAVRDAEMEFGTNPSEQQIRSFYPSDVSTDFDKIKKYHVKSYMGDALFGNDKSEDPLEFKDQYNNNSTEISEDDLFADMFREEEDKKVNQNFSPDEQKVVDLVTKKGQPFVQVALSQGISTAEIRKIMRRWYDLTNK